MNKDEIPADYVKREERVPPLHQESMYGYFLFCAAGIVVGFVSAMLACGAWGYS